MSKTKFKQGDKVIIRAKNSNDIKLGLNGLTGTVISHYVLDNEIFNQVKFDHVIGYALWERGFKDNELKLIKDKN